MSTKLQTQVEAGSKASDVITTNNAVKRHFSSRRGFSAEAQRHPIQAKLKIGQSGDKYEQEADRVADQVMRMPEPGNSISTGFTKQVQQPNIQRMCPEREEELRMQPCEECEEEIQRQPVDEEEEEELLQAKESTGHTPTVTPKIHGQINSLRGGGQPLSESDRSFFEPRFGYDFSQVLIHTRKSAIDTASTLDARAFTVGQDIVFGAGQYAPETYEGGRLLAHELTHVIQQRENKNREVKGKVQRSETDTLSQCPAYYRYNASIPISEYNCAGLAHRTYVRMGRRYAFPYFSSPVVSRVSTSDTRNPGQVKYWVWNFDGSFEADGHRIRLVGRRLPGGGHHTSRTNRNPRPDFHMVAGITDLQGNDPTDVYSKNGGRSVHGPGTGPSFMPPGREHATRSDSAETPMNSIDEGNIPIFRVRSNMRESCYCAPCPQRSF